MSNVLEHRKAASNKKDILEGVRAHLDTLSDEELAAVPDTGELARRTVKLVATSRDTFGRIIGPVYSSAALETLWGISRQAVSKRAQTGKLLTLKVGRSTLFPVFQFDSFSSTGKRFVKT